MKQGSKKILGSLLMVLILFSTIGFNIISTFCNGCEVVSTKIGITQSTDNMNCECVIIENQMSCCSPEKHETNHRSTLTLAQLKFDSPEARSKSFQFAPPVILVHFVSILFDYNLRIDRTFNPFIEGRIPPSSGRIILALNCILRN